MLPPPTGHHTYHDGPRSHFIWSSSEEILQIEVCITSFDDLWNGTGDRRSNDVAERATRELLEQALYQPVSLAFFLKFFSFFWVHVQELSERRAVTVRSTQTG